MMNLYGDLMNCQKFCKNKNYLKNKNNEKNDNYNKYL